MPTQNGTKDCLFLPIESPIRELEAKLLVALEAVSKRYDVVIGSEAMLTHLQGMPSGTLLYKDASQPMLEKFRRLRHNRKPRSGRRRVSGQRLSEVWPCLRGGAGPSNSPAGSAEAIAQCERRDIA